MRSSALLVIGLSLLTATVAHSAPAPKADPKVVAEAQKLARAARDSRSAAAGAEAQIVHLRERLVQLAAVESSGERGAGDKRTRLEVLNQQEQALTQRLGQSQNSIARLLGALALFRRDPPPALLVHPSSAKDAVRAQILARAMAPALEAKSRALTAQVENLKKLRRQVEGLSEDLFRSESELAEERAQMETQMTQLAILEKGLKADAEINENALRLLAQKSGAPADLIGRLPTEAEMLGPAPDHFIEPVPGKLIARFHAPEKDGSSEGMRWQTSLGAPVLAPAAGLVEYAGPLKDYGVILILRTGGAYHLVLAGLGTANAVVGRTVSAGEPIGRMNVAGPTPELYLEVRRGAETVDPSHWFKLAAR